jgi:hypothetical protein
MVTRTDPLVLLAGLNGVGPESDGENEDGSGVAAFTPLTLEELFALDLPELDWLVDELLPRGSFGMLAAREKAGKGLLTVDLCACIAGGEPFLDEAVREGKVIYCAAEENLGTTLRPRIGSRIGMDRSSPFEVLPLNGFTDDRLKLEDFTTVARLAGMITERGPALVVLDTMRELHAGNEDSSNDMNWRLRPLRELAHSTNTTILLNHHMNRNGTFRGSTSIKGAMDFEWEFTRDSDDVSVTGTLKIDGRWPAPPRRIRFNPDTFRWELTVAPEMEDTSLRGRLLQVLAEVGDWLTAEAMAENLGANLKSVQNTVAAMRKETPPRFAIKGEGNRGNPRRYHTLTPRLEPYGRVDIVESFIPEPLRGNDLTTNPDRSRNGHVTIPGTSDHRHPGEAGDDPWTDPGWRGAQ